MLTSKSFKSKALKRLNSGDVSKVHPEHVEVIQDILAIMKATSALQDVDLPGMRLHSWKGGGDKKAKTWSLDVSGNFRLLFKHDKETGLFYDLDYDDPH